MNLELKIEDLISENRSDFEVSKCIKDEIKSYIASLSSIFEENQGKNFLVEHTKRIDSYIKAIFKYALRKHFREFMPLINTLPITLVSLGSYAREQLCVYSDIDLMIVYKDVDGYNLKPIIETILQVAWDCGLKLGHRVHEIDDLYPASKTDQTIKTAFLESRFLCGSKYLWMHAEREMKRIRAYEQKAYILEKVKERDERRHKYPFSMEPNIKSSPGGLRDLNTLYWIASTLYNITKVKDLSPKIFNDVDYSALMSSVDFLFRVRVALHVSAGKKQDQLLLQYIPDIAEKLQLSQRRLVEKTFESMLKIEILCEYMTRLITNGILFEKQNIAKFKKQRVEKNLYICNQTAYAPLHVRPTKIVHYIDTFLTLPDQPYYFDINYVMALRGARHWHFDSEKLKALFYRKHLYGFFIALYRSKQLGYLFPAMKKVSHLPQFDGYHKYPVDIHSIHTLKAFENIEDKHVKVLFDALSEDDKAYIKLISFLHDCGKGREKDHSALGAMIIKNVVKDLKFDESYVEMTDILIRYHILMSHVASRQDIYSEKVIYSFIAKLKSPKILRLLYILTYADITGVGKGVYSPYTAGQLQELYQISLEAFENQELISEAQKRAKKEKSLEKEDQFKALKPPLQKKILNIESNLLFFKYKPTQIVDIASWIDTLQTPYDFRLSNEKHLTIEIIRSESINLGFLLGKCSQLNVSSMDIFKFFNGIKYFKITFHECVEEIDLQLIQGFIKESFDMSKTCKLNPPKIGSNEIKIDCDHSNTYASMTLDTKDQPGLLANIMLIFDDIGIDIASAKIQTIKNRARNLFLIEKNGNFCANQNKIVSKLTTNT